MQAMSSLMNWQQFRTSYTHF